MPAKASALRGDSGIPEFRGIPYHNGDFEALVVSKVFDRHARVVAVPFDTLWALRDRISELSAIVEQNALTEDDLTAWSNAGFVTGPDKEDPEDA